MLESLQKHFSHSLAGQGALRHFAAHSHHLWPDVTRSAHLQAWEDATTLADRKWEKLFGEVIPEAQAHIARQLQLPDPATIAFAPNTHDLVLRLLSCLGDKPRILTTDSEFHSAERQFRRLEEDGLIAVTRIPTAPFETFAARFAEAAAASRWDMVFFSQVFFNSGWVLEDLASVLQAVKTPETLMVIDGYHGFMALPTDLSGVADRAFYLGGGYKYAMAGEGVCFLHAPPAYGLRPRNTGWFAAFGALESQSHAVAYGQGGGRFLGATFDPSGLYRFNAVQRWLIGEGISVTQIHQHVEALQQQFLEGLDENWRQALLNPITPRGHFLTFDFPDALTRQRDLLARNILTDVRGTRLRFGFGIYHTSDDVRELVACL